MNPSYPDPTPSGIDYLNQIAPPPPPAGIDKKTKIIIFFMILLGITSLAIIGVGVSNSGKKDPTLVTIAGRLQKVHRVATKYNKKINSSSLRTANSSLIAITTTANKSAEVPLTNTGVDLKKNAKVIATMDPSVELEKKLDDAYLNAQFDEVYGREMLFLLQESIVLAKQIYSGTSSKSSKEFLQKTTTDLEGVAESFRIIVEQSP